MENQDISSYHFKPQIANQLYIVCSQILLTLIDIALQGGVWDVVTFILMKLEFHMDLHGFVI